MNFANPTNLKVGLKGRFAGKEFILTGRVVMGVTIAGETYYWQEYQLQADTGENAVLVFEPDEAGNAWRLFTEFNPDYTLTAAEAAAKQVGDSLNLTGTDVRVTLVQSSKVYYLEGQAPEGVTVGSRANYFNAEAGDVMQVVSWTGTEVEYYNGLSLSATAVARAFQLPRLQVARPMNWQSGRSTTGDASSNSLGQVIFWAVIIGCVGLLVIAPRSGCRRSNAAATAAVPRIPAAASPPLKLEATGVWQGTRFRVTAHAVTEIAGYGAVYQRHEYQLVDENGQWLTVTCGNGPTSPDWYAYRELTLSQAPDAMTAAGKKMGDIIVLGRIAATIRVLFQSRIVTLEKSDTTDWQSGATTFGFWAEGTADCVLARWDQSAIHYYSGQKVSAKTFAATFNPTTAP
ncbi:MAG TPA: DUF4178 domain-containing protein [Verrucomicrobiae bacterium]